MAKVSLRFGVMVSLSYHDAEARLPFAGRTPARGMHPAILARGRSERRLGLNPASGPHHLVVAVEEMQAAGIEDETDGLADGHVGGVADDAHGQRADLVGGDIGIGIRP